MKIITQRTLIREVASRWAAQFPEEIAGRAGVGARLDALDVERATPAEVEAIIGNDTWTRTPACDECKRDGFPLVIQLGDEPDYESHTVTVCYECLGKAAALAARVR